MATTGVDARSAALDVDAERGSERGDIACTGQTAVGHLEQ